MYTAILILHILVCLAIIFIILLQKSKGAEMGAAFGGSSQTIFGTSGALTFLNKVTTIVAVLFMFTSIMLAHISTPRNTQSVVTEQPAAEQPAAPAAPAPAEEKAQPQKPVASSEQSPSAQPIGSKEQSPQAVPVTPEKPAAPATAQPAQEQPAQK